MENIEERIDEISGSALRKKLIEIPLSEWAVKVADEVSVYRLGEQYIAKSFDEIPYRLCSKEKAQDILEENLDALLTFKYFPKATDEETDRIREIKKYCVNRIASSLIKVKFSEDGSNARLMRPLPSSCIAFNNGVYDFKADDWLFRYETTEIEGDGSKKLISYSPDWRIMWYINRDFTPVTMAVDENGKFHAEEKEEKEGRVSPLELSFEEWIDFMKDLDETRRSRFFELFWNMSYGADYRFSESKAEHLAEIFGFLVYPSFVQNFVFFVGDGSNGKDSMFDGFFREMIRPIPVANSVSSLEEDKFVIGSLVGASQNISSETETSVLRKSAVLKQVTGSQYQTIEEKGVDKYTGYLNCKFVFSANRKEQLKFGDSSVGFRRRINMYECFYQWDKAKRYLSLMKGTYDTGYNDLSELREGDSLWEFFYTCMHGVSLATKGFTERFSFTENDFNASEYAEEDETFRTTIEGLSVSQFRTHVKMDLGDLDYMFVTEDGNSLYRDKGSKSHFAFMDYYPKKSYREALIDSLTYNDKATEENGQQPIGQYFLDNNIYVSIWALLEICDYHGTKTKFTQDLKKSYPNCRIRRFGANRPYVLCSFGADGKLVIM